MSVARRRVRGLGSSFWVACLNTFVLFAVPVATAWIVQNRGGTTALLLSIAAGIAASIITTMALSALWTRLPWSGERVFADMTVWGWVRCERARRQVAASEQLFSDPRVVRIDLHTEALVKLAGALEARDAQTHGHSKRVARHAGRIAERMGLTDEEVSRIRIAAAMHDVGKLTVPIGLLRKTGQLTDAETAIVRKHAEAGAEMISLTGEAELADLVRHHHERFAGGGYPDGIAGDAIPLGARIIAVADTFDAIASTRPYRERSAHRTACKLIEEQSGEQFDPQVVDAFLEYYRGGSWTMAWGAASVLPARAVTFGSDLLRGGATAAAAATVAVGVSVSGPIVGASSAAPADRVVRSAPGAAAIAPGVADRTTGTDERRGDRDSRDRDKPGDDSSPRSNAPSDSGGGGSSSGSSAGSHGGSNEAKAPVEVPPAPAPVKDVVGGVGGTVGGVVDTVDDTLTPITQGLDTTLGDTVETVDGTVGGLLGRGK